MYIYDMKVHRGETFYQSIRILGTDGKALNLSGKIAKAQVRPEPDSSTLSAEMTATIDTDTGRITFSLSAAQTQALAVGHYFYDVCAYETISGVRQVIYYIGGKFDVLPSVTKAVN